MITSFIHPDWRERLAAAGLVSLEQLLAAPPGDCLSRHPRRGYTSLCRLADDTQLFVKVDRFTYFKELCADLCHGRRPGPNTAKEREAYTMLAELGIGTPHVVAWFLQSRCGWPGAGAMITLPVAGHPLNAVLEEETDPARREAFLRQAEEVLKRMFRAGLDWPDYKTEHFFLQGNGSFSLIDLERLRRRKPFSEARITAELQNFRRLAAAGGKVHRLPGMKRA